MTQTFEYLNLLNLPEFSFIAGSDQELTFNAYTSACALVDLSGATVVFKMYRYGNPEVTMVSKAGSLTGSPINQFRVKVDALDTAGSSGKFMQTFSITDASGSALRPSMGIVNLIAYPS